MSYDHYNKTIGGAKADVYRICEMYGVTSPAIFQSIKKLLRCGQAHKDARQDVIEARDGLNRWLEMDEEDADVNTPTIPNWKPMQMKDRINCEDRHEPMELPNK